MSRNSTKMTEIESETFYNRTKSRKFTCAGIEDLGIRSLVVGSVNKKVYEKD